MYFTDLIQSLSHMRHRALAVQLQCGGTSDTEKSYKDCDVYFCSISSVVELAINFIWFSRLVKLPKEHSGIKVFQHLV